MSGPRTSVSLFPSFTFSRVRSWLTNHPWRMLIFILGLLFALRTIYTPRSARRRTRPSEAPGPPVLPLPTPSSLRCLACVPEDTSATPVSTNKPVVTEAGDDFLEPDFKAACTAASRLTSLDTFQKLRLYAYFKQATVGVCNVPRPSMLDIPGCAKWDAWKALGDISSSSAKEYYTNMVTELSQGGNSSSSSSGSEGGSGFAMGPTMSRMAEEEEKIDEADKDIFIFASEGNQEAVLRLLEQKVDVNSTNADGLTPLHWAVDRGNKELAELLLLHKADIDAVDTEKATPLHYAVDCDHLELVALLLKAGANPDAENAAGEKAKEAASPEVLPLFERDLA